MNAAASAEKRPAPEPPRSCRLPSCPGHYERRRMLHDEPGPDGRTLLIDDVPANVCTVCGDTLFPPETAEALDAWRDALDAGTAPAPDRTDLFHFARAAQVA